MPEEQLKSIRKELGELGKIILELRQQCEQPQRVAELESAIRSIRGNAVEPDEHTLPWIVQRCDGVVKP